MKHIIMSGPIKPLTNVERAFFAARHAEIREDIGLPPKPQVECPKVKRAWKEVTDEVIIDAGGRSETYVTLKRAMALLGRARFTVTYHASRGGWGVRNHPADHRVYIYKLADVMRTAERLKQRRK